MTIDAPAPAAGRRRRARELALQGLYQRQLSGNDATAIGDEIVASAEFAEADPAYFGELWRGTLREYDALIESFAPLLDRAPAALSPIERAIIVLAAWELAHRHDVPYRVVINEAVDLAKSYGGTDGHKYVNGVLDKLAQRVRADEIAALARERAQ